MEETKFQKQKRQRTERGVDPNSSHTVVTSKDDQDNGHYCKDKNKIIVPRITLTLGKSDNEQNDNNQQDVVIELFQKYQAVYLPRYHKNKKRENNDDDKAIAIDGYDNTKGINRIKKSSNERLLHWKDLFDIYKNLNDKDKESFCIENDDDSKHVADIKYFLKDRSSSSSSIIPKDDNNNHKEDKDGSYNNDVGYCSFLVQNDKNALVDMLRRLPVRDLSNANGENKNDGTSNENNNSDVDISRPYCWKYEPCLWVFFGRNNNDNKKDLQGRPEHTDQISHDGTWHYQLSGTKQWLLRPTPTLIRQFKKEQYDNHDYEKETKEEEEVNREYQQQQICIDCQEGDVIIVNTRLWKHQTIIPTQIEPSVSYARDFWIHDNINNDNKEEKSDDGSATTYNNNMTNIDGLYAADDIEKNTVIFTEDDMPDCELHRSSTTNVANCELVQLPDGKQAVVSKRNINAGEFFCIPNSSDEEDDDDDESEDEDEEDEM